MVAAADAATRAIAAALVYSRRQLVCEEATRGCRWLLSRGSGERIVYVTLVVRQIDGSMHRVLLQTGSPVTRLQWPLCVRSSATGLSYS